MLFPKHLYWGGCPAVCHIFSRTLWGITLKVCQSGGCNVVSHGLSLHLFSSCLLAIVFPLLWYVRLCALPIFIVFFLFIKVLYIISSGGYLLNMWKYLFTGFDLQFHFLYGCFYLSTPFTVVNFCACLSVSLIKKSFLEWYHQYGRIGVFFHLLPKENWFGQLP